MIFVSRLLLYFKQLILHHHHDWWLNSNSKNTISSNIDQLSVWKIWCLWEWGQSVPGLWWGVSEVNSLQNFHWDPENCHEGGKKGMCNVSSYQDPCSLNSIVYGNALQHAFLLRRISMVLLLACWLQSEWLLSQNYVFRLTGVWNSFTSLVYSDFILNQ